MEQAAERQAIQHRTGTLDDPSAVWNWHGLHPASVWTTFRTGMGWGLPALPDLASSHRYVQLVRYLAAISRPVIFGVDFLQILCWSAILSRCRSGNFLMAFGRCVLNSSSSHTQAHI